MILAFQRWIICAHEQVPRDMDVFCACTQIFDFQLCIICKSLLRFGESVSAQNPTMVRRDYFYVSIKGIIQIVIWNFCAYTENDSTSLLRICVYAQIILALEDFVI